VSLADQQIATACMANELAVRAANRAHKSQGWQWCAALRFARHPGTIQDKGKVT
jgi:hypothetical protein